MNKLHRMTAAVMAAFLVLGFSATVDAAKLDKNAKSEGRSYYLSRDTFQGYEASEACATGYHLASIWEIWHFSALTYNSDLGRTLADSPYGPSESSTGWVGSGRLSDASFNCQAWTSGDSQQTGLTMSLSVFQIIQGFDNPWVHEFRACNFPNYAWCVSDPIF